MLGKRANDLTGASQKLAAVAGGREDADLVIKNGRWVNVHTAEIIPDTDLAISQGRIAYIGPDAQFATGDDTEVIDADGRYMLPGLCDAHMHIESGMLTVTEFCRAVIPHGTTTMFVDPHEIANVLGLAGVRAMHDEAQAMPVNVYVQMPSCVPSAPGLEDAAATIGPDEVAEAMSWPGIIGLGEMMSFPSVAAGDERAHAILARASDAGKVIGGHFPADTNTADFHSYVASGPSDDHEVTSMSGAIDRARRGVRTMLRLGSAWYDVAETVRAITECGLDSRYFVLCTDDSHSGTLVNDGHMDRVVRHAISRGLKPITAIQMASLNTAEHFGVAHDVGSLAPGRYGDVIVTSDLVDLPLELVLSKGKVLARDGALGANIPPYEYPSEVFDTVRISRELTAADFDIPVENDAAEVMANVIGVIENQAPTEALQRKIAVVDGMLTPSFEQGDVARVSVIERHSGEDVSVANALVGGFGLSRQCAIASTVMHDAHNLLVVGTDQASMVQAANCLRGIGGGITVWMDGKQEALVEMPIAGLMSSERAEVVSKKANQAVMAMRRCGCELNNAIMQLSLLGLAVIPELRISNRGLVDVRTFKLIDLVAN